MTHRMSLFLGLLVALSVALPATVFGTENNSLAWGAEVSAQRSTSGEQRVSAASAATWKSSSPNGPIEIRFKKPAAVLLTDRPTDIANEEASPEPAGELESIRSAATPVTHVSRSPIVTSATANSATMRPPTARAAPAPAPAAQPIETNEQPIKTVLPASQPRIDENVRLVARMFQEDSVGDVPPVPGDEPVQRKTNGKGNGNNNGQSDDSDDYNYAGEDYGAAYCPPPAPPLMWVAGVEATFLSPDINSDGVTFLFEEYANERSDWVSSQSSEIDSMYVAPRIWLGVQGCKWGANVRYWHMNANEGYFDPSIGAGGFWDTYDCGRPDLGFISNSRFEAYTVDLEITRRFCLHDCWMQFSAGVRHAELEHGELLTGTALTDEATFLGFAAADRYTRGTGIIFGLYGRKPLFPCSCVHWFYNVRWSALWGPTETRVETAAAVLGEDADAASINGAYTCVDDNLFVGEIQLGLEWNYALRCMPANYFFRAAVEYQRWDGGQGYSESGSFAGIEVDDDFSAVVETFAASAAPELDLVGITLGTGLTW